MIGKKIITTKILFVLIVFAIILTTLNIINSQEVSYCCEKTKSGAWCQNSPKGSCDTSNGLRETPASCGATSFCKMGYCYDSQEGTCSENTPQKVCELNGGVWEENKGTIPPQCNLGCCVLENQAAFTTQTRCKKLSSFYGLETDFRTNIKNEMECIANAFPSQKGACVFEKEFQKTCKFVTRNECNNLKIENSSINFYPDTLCSDEKLGTNCGPSEKTTCVEGKDEVYFVDTCGNIANIYDASKIKDKLYWSKIVPKENVCNPNSANANSATCGNCDYFLGSACKGYKSGEDKVRPNYGDFICRDLSCRYEGKIYKHGETWCADSKGISENLPGSRAFRLVCYEGEVSVEPCADYRQEVCLQTDINGFKNAACRANLWQDCTAQKTKKNCENQDKRDCVWKPGVILKLNKTNNEAGTCLPKNPPGLNLDGEESVGICSIANKECIVKYEKKIIGEKKCIENCECLSSSFANQMNNACNLLGDCGVKVNYIGIQGYNTLDDALKKDKK